MTIKTVVTRTLDSVDHSPDIVVTREIANIADAEEHEKFLTYHLSHYCVLTLTRE